MNQILYVGENKGNGPKAIKSIVKFFAIVIIVFGIILMGKGSYAIYKNIEINSGDNIPVVYMDRVNNTVVIKAEDNIEISKLIYSWNKGEETILLPNSKKVEEVVLLPNENSVLNVTIVDTKGKETKFMQEWNIEGTDIRKPEIEITTDEDIRKITIIARDETEINYLIYKWNEEEEIKINATENDKLKIQETIDMILGENIGTCVTTLAAGVGTGAAARSVTWFHLFFNVVGTMAALPVLAAIFHLLPQAGTAMGSAVGLAMFHTMFNAFNIAVFGPWIHQMQRINRSM